MNEEGLSIDLDNIIPDDTDESPSGFEDIMPDDAPTTEETPDVEEPMSPEITEEPTPETEEPVDGAESDTDMDGLFAEIDELVGDTEDVTEIKDKVEQVQEALNTNDDTQVTQLIDELYTLVLTYEAEKQQADTKYQVVKSKLDEKQKQLEELIIQNEESSISKMSADPKVKMLNRYVDDALSGNKTAKDKATQALEELYFAIKGEEIGEPKEVEITKVKSSVTEPKIEEKEDKFDPTEGFLGIF